MRCPVDMKFLPAMHALTRSNKYCFGSYGRLKYCFGSYGRLPMSEVRPRVASIVTTAHKISQGLRGYDRSNMEGWDTFPTDRWSPHSTLLYHQRPFTDVLRTPHNSSFVDLRHCKASQEVRCGRRAYGSRECSALLGIGSPQLLQHYTRILSPSAHWCLRGLPNENFRTVPAVSIGAPRRP